METERLDLRPLRGDDAEALNAAYATPPSSALAPLAPRLDIAATAAMLTEELAAG